MRGGRAVVARPAVVAGAVVAGVARLVLFILVGEVKDDARGHAVCTLMFNDPLVGGHSLSLLFFFNYWLLLKKQIAEEYAKENVRRRKKKDCCVRNYVKRLIHTQQQPRKKKRKEKQQLKLLKQLNLRIGGTTCCHGLTEEYLRQYFTVCFSFSDCAFSLPLFTFKGEAKAHKQANNNNKKKRYPIKPLREQNRAYCRNAVYTRR